jgi:hypothetical protein
VERQARFAAGIDKTGLRLCGGCAFGKQVQERSGVVIDPANFVVVRGRARAAVPRAPVPAVNAEVLPCLAEEKPQETPEITAVPRAPTPPVPAESPKNQDAVALGRRGGLKGGKARAQALSPEERTAAASKAAKVRWCVPGSDFAPTIVSEKPEPALEKPWELTVQLSAAEIERLAEAAIKDGETIEQWSKEALLGVAHVSLDNPSFRLTAAGREVTGALIEEVPTELTRDKLERAIVLHGELKGKDPEEATYEDWFDFLESHGLEVLCLALAALGRITPPPIERRGKYQKHKLGATQQRIVDLFGDGKRLTVTDISRELGHNYQNTRRMLPVLERRGLIRNEFDQLREATVWMRSGAVSAAGITPPSCEIGVAEGESPCGNLADHRMRLGKDYIYSCASCAQGYVDVGAFEDGEDAELIKL